MRVPASLRAAAVILAGAGACETGDVAEPTPLTITLTAEPSTTVVGEDVTFRFQATGTNLTSITLDFGDGTTHAIGTSGARTASGSALHAYNEAGEYEVVATVLSGAVETATAAAAVVVTPPLALRRRAVTGADPAPEGGFRMDHPFRRRGH
jgi:PKD repeat protein